MMKRLSLMLIGFGVFGAVVSLAQPVGAQRRKVVVHPKKVVVRRPVVHTKLVVRPNHPVRRVLPNAVVVRPARKTVVVGAPLVYLSSVRWSPVVVAPPAGDRLVWQDSESIDREEGWVDTNFGVDQSGNALFLDVNGRAALNFAEVIFANGNVQVVDFAEQTHGPGVYRLLDFADGRNVKTVRLLAKSESEETKLAVYLSK